VRVRASKNGRNKGWEAMDWFESLVGKVSSQGKKLLNTLLLKIKGKEVML